VRASETQSPPLLQFLLNSPGSCSTSNLQDSARVHASPDCGAYNAVLGALARAEHVEVIIAFLPDTTIARLAKLARAAPLEQLKSSCQASSFRFARQQMHVFGHNNIANNLEPIPAAHALQYLLKGRVQNLSQKCLVAGKGEGDVMQLCCLLVPF
jgi:hypothetical protein